MNQVTKCDAMNNSSKEQCVLMTAFELEFLPQRKTARPGANSICKHYTSLFDFGLQCQMGGVCNQR